MTTLPPPRPIRPVLRRMALGLGLTLLGGFVAWRGATFTPTPGLETTLTPLEVPLDGPLPFDYAQAATLRFEGNRPNLLLNPLPPSSPLLLSGEARHRTRNPASFTVRRNGRNVNVTAKLYVKSLASDRVLPPAPEPFQHTLQASLSANLPLTLNTYTVGGNQTVNLAGLRVRALTARSDSGHLDLALPARPGGPYALVTRSGQVEVTAPAGATPEALRVNSQSGDLTLNLKGAAMDALNAGTQSGNLKVILPKRFNRGSMTTDSGDVQVTLPTGTHGNLDIRSLRGDVNLEVAARSVVRVRFTDRETLLLPPGTSSATAPQVDIFVDIGSGDFRLNGHALDTISPPTPPETPYDSTSRTLRDTVRPSPARR